MLTPTPAWGPGRGLFHPSGRWWRPAALVAAVAGATLLVSACGGGGAVGNLEGVASATVRIEVDGTIVEPDAGVSTNAGSGSGFFISPDGLAVTNNHVVVGAGRIEVFVGNDPVAYRASVVGVSECNDLALIDVDVDGDVPYLEWFTGDITVGLDVYTAGFPLGDPEFTLSRGVVSKAQAGDQILTTVADVDRAIEHDANIQAGNSGGPLVDTSGRVVGVNYAGTGDYYGVTEQFFAIAADAAEPVVERLRDGDDESLGLNTSVFADTSGLVGITGLWVAGVTPGSPAAKAGIEPGDVLTTMNGIELGVDPFDEDPDLAGRFYAAYCDVIRSAGNRPIAIEVVRTPTGEVLSGEINGDSPLAGTGIAGTIEDLTDVPAGEEAYGAYTELTDATGTITVTVPSEWGDVDLGPATGDLPFIEAAPNLVDFNETFTTPGMAFFALPAGTSTAEIITDLSAPVAAQCNDAGAEPYEDGVFAGEVKVWDRCADRDIAYVIVATTAAARPEYSFATIVQVVDQRDLDALERILESFNFA